MDTMKRFTVLLSLSVLTLFFTLPEGVLAQERGNEEPRVSPNARVSQTIGTTKIEIGYSRPSVNNRTIFGDLQPFGQVWRTGANEATTISFSDDVKIEGNTLKAGTYGLFTIPGKEKWTVIFNNVPNQWGAFDYDSSKDALRVEVTSENGPKVEQLMFYFTEVSKTSGTLVLHWNDVKVPVRITLPDSSDETN